MTMLDDVNQGEDLPDYVQAKGFYARYEPKEILGRGVSSVVRRCVEKDSGREYAVKIIDLTGDKDNELQMEEIRVATHKEMNILRLCAEQPHIIELHDTFESQTFIFLVFELCKRGELFDYLTEVVALSEKRTRQIMRQLLEAVEFVHSKNVVHRDLKPENILLDDQMNVKLSDFGFATVISNEEELSDLCGTPGYLAPEVLKASMYEAAVGYGRPVDMWACGVIMYTLLVGCPPFWHRKQMYMLRAIMEGKYSFLNPEWNDISEPPKDLISKLLVVNPEDRLTSKEALAHPFFKREEQPMPFADLSLTVVPKREKVKQFAAKRMFKAAVLSVLAVHRIQYIYTHPPPISIETAKTEPYGLKTFRKIIDAGAFRVYGHWVKRGENQNRAALFENTPKKDMTTSESDEQPVEPPSPQPLTLKIPRPLFTIGELSPVAPRQVSPRGRPPSPRRPMLGHFKW